MLFRKQSSSIACKSRFLRYGFVMSPAPQPDKPMAAAAKAEAVRIERLQKDAERPMRVNLAEGIALSHQLMRFTGAAQRS